MEEGPEVEPLSEHYLVQAHAEVQQAQHVHSQLQSRSRLPGDQLEEELAAAIPLLVEILRQGTHEGRAAAAAALRLSCKHADARNKIVAANGIPPLVQLLFSGSLELVQAAASMLGSISLDAGGSAKLVEAGAVHPLVKLLGRGFWEDARAAAASALEKIAMEPGSRSQLVAAGAVPPLEQLLSSKLSKSVHLSAAATLAILNAGGPNASHLGAAAWAEVIGFGVPLVAAGALLVLLVRTPWPELRSTLRPLGDLLHLHYIHLGQQQHPGALSDAGPAISSLMPLSMPALMLPKQGFSRSVGFK